MIISLIIYSVAFIVSLILCYIYEKNIDKNSKKNRIIWGLIIIMPTVLVSGLRYGIGIDFFEYDKQFNEVISNENVNYRYYLQEPLNLVLIYISNIIFRCSQGYFFIYAFLTMMFAFKAIESYKNKISMTLGLFIFYMVYYLVSFNIIRQMLAVVIVLYALKYIEKRNFKKYVLYVILAMTVHKTAIIALFFYLLQCDDKEIVNNKRKTIIYYSSIMILPIIGIFILKFIFSKFSLFSKYLNMQTNISVTFLMYLLPIMVLLIYKRKDILKADYQNELFVRLYIMQIPLNIVGWVIQYTNRFALYTGISQILLIPILQKNIKDELHKKIITVLIILWYIFYFVVMFVILKSNNVLPYKMINFYY